MEQSICLASITFHPLFFLLGGFFLFDLIRNLLTV